jgi:hypothetical protein
MGEGSQRAGVVDLDWWFVGHINSVPGCHVPRKILPPRLTAEVKAPQRTSRAGGHPAGNAQAANHPGSKVKDAG